MNPDPTALEQGPAGTSGSDSGPDREDARPQPPHESADVSQALRLLSALERERAELLRTALALAGSRSWRLSRWLSRAGRGPRSRGAGARPALDTLIERLVNLELRLGPLDVMPRAGAEPASPPLPDGVDVVLWGADERSDLTAVRAQISNHGVNRLFVPGRARLTQDDSGDEVEVVRVPETTPATGAAWIDAALRLSDAPLIVLLQEGLDLPSGWSEQLRRAAESSAEVGMVAATCDRWPMPTRRTARPPWLVPEVVSLLAGGDPGQRLRASVFDAGCVAITRGALAEVGGLDPLLGDGQHAITEFAARLSERGWACVLADDVLVQPAGGPLSPPADPGRRLRRRARRGAGRLTARDADRRYARAELRGLLQLEERVGRVVASPERFARELSATGRRPLSSVWVAMALPGAPRASALAAGGDAAALRQLGLQARLAIPAHQLSRFPQIEVDEALRFTDRTHLEALLRDTDVVIAAHPAALPLLEGLPQRREQVLACVLRELPDEPADARLGGLALLAPSTRLCRQLAERFGWLVAPYPLSADARFFHPTPDEPDSRSGLQVAIHLTPVAAQRGLAIRELLAQALPPGTRLVSFGSSLTTLDRRGAREGSWREFHLGSVEPAALARLLGATDIMVDVTPAPTGQVAAAAMSCAAIPVVAHESAAAELVDAGRNGLVMRSADPQRWRDAVVNLAADWPRLRRLQTAAVQSAAGRGELHGAMSLYLRFERIHHALLAAGPGQDPLTSAPVDPIPASASGPPGAAG